MKALLKLILPLLVLVNFTRAQVILPLGIGQNNSINITCSEGDKLWVLTDEQGKFGIHKWDGNFWIKYNDIPPSLLNQLSVTHADLEANAITVFQGELYAAFTNKSTGKLLILKASGKNWDQVNTDKIIIEKDIEFISDGNTLWLCGKILYDNKSIAVLKIDKLNTSIFAYSPAFNSNDDYYSNFEYSGGRIWAIGLFSSPFDHNKRYFTSLENGVWRIVDNPPGLFGFEGLGRYNDRLIIVAKGPTGKLSIVSQNSNLYVWDGISNGLDDWSIKSVSNIHQAGKELWMAGEFYNAMTNRQASLAFWDGKSWQVPSFDYLGNDIVISGSKQVFITGSFASHQGMMLNKTGELDFGSAIINGKVFYDPNQNCSQDFGERSLQGLVVKLTPENIFAITNYNGRYYFLVDSSVKIHGVELQSPKFYVPTCDGFKATRHASQLTIAGVDFGIMPNGNHTNATVIVSDYTGWRARQGFDEQYNLCVTNKGTQAIETGKLELKADTRLNIWGFSQPPSAALGNKFEWALKSIPVGETHCISLKATISMNIPLGDKLMFEAEVYTTDVQDEDLSDNQSVLDQTVVAAIDPNDKKTKQGFFISPSTKMLDYKIRFQNTGTDTAYDITVKDTIDGSLFIDKSFINPTSHEKTCKIDFDPVWWKAPDGSYRYKFSWRFNNILLPDSNTNEEASHGYINYGISVRPTLKLGTLIRNRAYIFFDRQEPIVTNTALNYLSTNTGIKSLLSVEKLDVHPNPAHDIVNITNPLKSEIKFTLINSLGQDIFSETVAAESNFVLQTSGLSPGLYLINAEGYAPFKILLH